MYQNLECPLNFLLLLRLHLIEEFPVLHHLGLCLDSLSPGVMISLDKKNNISTDLFLRLKTNYLPVGLAGGSRWHETPRVHPRGLEGPSRSTQPASRAEVAALQTGECSA